MSVTRREFLSALTATGAIATLAACGGKQADTPAATTDSAPEADLSEFKSLALDMKAWHYDSDHKVWWQMGLAYCTKPASQTYEKLSIYVPGAYLKPTDEKVDLTDVEPSKTFECELDPTATVGSYSCATAPVMLPINAPGFSAQPAPTSYLFDGLEPYLSAGLVYVYAGCRGRSNGYDSSSAGEGFFSGGAPWGIADLKAAVRYLRYNQKVLPGDMGRIVTCGLAAGGLLAAIMGASGGSDAYGDYLAKIGAATHDAEGNAIGDDVSAVATWCPEPPAGSADAAYEWELGQFGDKDSRAEGVWTRIASTDLAGAYASYLNGLALRDGDLALTLEETDGGVWMDGSYYDHLVSVVETSASKFLSTTQFPHAIDQREADSGEFPGSGVAEVETPATPVVSVTENAATTAAPATTGEPEAAATEPSPATTGAAATAPATSEATSSDDAAKAAATAPSVSVTNPEPKSTSVTYATLGDYVSALNANGQWLTFNEGRGTARIADLGSFVRACRMPTQPVCAFDTPQRSAVTNQLFGNDDSDSLHFSQQVADLLSSRSETYEQASGWNGSYPGDWAGDLAKKDSLDRTMEERRAMYDPFHFLVESTGGKGSSTVAPHWRINVGMAQASAPVTTGVNLALALKAYDGVSDVALTPVWGAGRRLAEEGGADATSALLSWVGGLYPAVEAATTDAATE